MLKKKQSEALLLDLKQKKQKSSYSGFPFPKLQPATKSEKHQHDKKEKEHYSSGTWTGRAQGDGTSILPEWDFAGHLQKQSLVAVQQLHTEQLNCRGWGEWKTIIASDCTIWSCITNSFIRFPCSQIYKTTMMVISWEEIHLESITSC